MYTLLTRQVQSNCQAMCDEGWSQLSGAADRRISDFYRLVSYVELKYQTVYDMEFIKSFVRKQPDTEVTSHPTNGQMFLVHGTWIPTWVMRLITYERKWRAQVNRTSDKHDDIVQALHSGLEGDMDQVDAFLCLKELESEYSEPEPSLMGTFHAYSTVDEIRQLMGVEPLPFHTTTIIK